jgi:hypothetical protein
MQESRKGDDGQAHSAWAAVGAAGTPM